MSHPYPFAREDVYVSLIHSYSDSSRLLPHSVLLLRGSVWDGQVVASLALLPRAVTLEGFRNVCTS